MNEPLKLLLSLSMSGSMLVLLILLMKPFMKHKLSKSIQYYIWIVVLLRLVIPFSLEGSIMNNVFGGNQLFASIDQVEVVPTNTLEAAPSLPLVPSGKEGSPSTDVYGDYGEKSKPFMQLFNHYAIYIWLFGVILSLTLKLSGYIRFSRNLRTTCKPVSDWENRMFHSLLDGRQQVKLVRSPFVATPMLIGIRQPTIIIPDTIINEIELKNILLHELTHLKRFDIAIKWFGVIVTSLHWFNPLMYVLNKEMNHMCELSCDEAVIRKLNSAQRQQYGETLISMASRKKYPAGGMQATFSEEKTILKERLIAIMRPSKKSKMIALLSVLLLVAVICSAVALGASVGTSKQKVNESNSVSSGTTIPVEPPSAIITHNGGDSDPIENYRILKSSWDGAKYDRQSFYQAAWYGEPTLLTGLRRLKPGEQMKVDFGSYTPDNVTVAMAYLTDSLDESLLPIIEVPVNKVDGGYEFINPPAAESDIATSGRVFSITATWGDNSCEYVFASDGKFDYETK